MKRVLTISLAILLLVPLTTVLSSAQSNYADGNYHTYYESSQPRYVTTNEVPLLWVKGAPEFIDPPSGINTGTVLIYSRSESPGTPEGA
jgi:hypothetical protein